MMIRGFVFLILLALLGSANAQDGPFARINIDPEELEVGQAATLRVSIFVPTWFTSPPNFPGFELTNAITRLPPDSSFPGSERINGTTWTSVNRDYKIYPLLGASYRIAGQTISAAYADPETNQPVETEIAIPEINFRGVVPAGAESLDPYVAGMALSLNQQVTGETDALAVGDAVVIEYTATLRGMPSIFVPPLVDQLDIPGVSVYSDEPVVSDEGEIATRTEKISLVFDAGGDFTIPGLDLSWWNTATKTIETAVTEKLSFSVEGPVADARVEETETVDKPIPWKRIAFLAVVFLAILYLGIRWYPKIRSSREEKRQRYLESEAYAFSHMRSVLGTGNARSAYSAILSWFDRMETSLSLREFLQDYGGGEGVDMYDQLSRSLYNGEAKNTDLGRLGDQLASARSLFLKTVSTVRDGALPALNPYILQ